MAWLVAMALVAGAATIGVLLARIERVRIQPPSNEGDGDERDARRTGSRGEHRLSTAR